MRIIFILCVVAWCVTSCDAQRSYFESPAFRAVTRSIDNLGKNLYTAFAENQSGNLIFSPISASLLVLMAAYGAQDQTLHQFNSAAGIPIRDPYIAEATFAFIDRFKHLKQVELYLANTIFISDRILPKFGFIFDTKNVFHSNAMSLDFQNRNEASEIINNWCEINTNDRIKDFVRPNDIDGSSRLFLLSAVYFNGKWKLPFDSADTTRRPFYSSTKWWPKYVPTMYSSKEYKSGELESINAQWIELPYESDFETGQISMFIILPNKINGLAELEKNLHRFTVDELLRDTFSRSNIYLPKFKIESIVDLKGPLHKIGLGEIFSDRANFDDIANESLKISKASQKAFIEINEESTEATAASAMEVSKRSNLSVLKVDHPFLFQIIMRSTKTILFQGRVVNIR